MKHLEVVRKGNFWYTKIAGKGTVCTIKSKQLVDCTGNASVAALAGYKLLQEKETQPGSLIFELEGYEYTLLDEKDLQKRYNEALKNKIIFKTDAYNGIKAVLTTRAGFLHGDGAKHRGSSCSCI